jgi:hypothetical protein
MNKLFLFACVLLPFTATAQTAPKVVFAGDNITAAWQGSSEFTANTNWIGEGIVANSGYDPSKEVLQDFQANVINQHPAFVHIMTGFSDADTIRDSNPLPYVLTAWEPNIIQMVAMAKQANIKVILGNVINLPTPGEDPVAISFMNAWLDQYGRANNIPVVNYNAAFCQCVGPFSSTAQYLPSYVIADGATFSITDAGYALLTQMAQTAIATYGLTIKGGYLSDVFVGDPSQDLPPQPQVNTVTVGDAVNFTAQATWSDGVVRPMLNPNYDGMEGIWTSSNPNVMYISQQGQALAYGVGTTSISFISVNGSHFAPWTITVNNPNPLP